MKLYYKCNSPSAAVTSCWAEKHRLDELLPAVQCKMVQELRTWLDHQAPGRYPQGCCRLLIVTGESDEGHPAREAGRAVGGRTAVCALPATKEPPSLSLDLPCPFLSPCKYAIRRIPPPRAAPTRQAPPGAKRATPSGSLPARRASRSTSGRRPPPPRGPSTDTRSEGQKACRGGRKKAPPTRGTRPICWGEGEGIRPSSPSSARGRGEDPGPEDLWLPPPVAR